MNSHENFNFRQRRRAFRLSVRVLMGLVLLIGGCWGWLINSARIQREAVEEIERSNGFVRYDWQETNGAHNGAVKPGWAPSWLFDRLGPDVFGTVVSVHLNGAADDDLRLLAPLRRVKTLSIFTGPRFSDEGLRHLGGLDRLEVLSLSDDLAIRDAGLEHLKGLPRLREITFGGARGPSRPEAPDIGDAGLETLGTIRSLRKVHFLAGNPTISDDALERLRERRPELVVVR